MALDSDAIRQAAAIPVKDGQLCLVTSRSGKRWVIPKGCLEPGKTTGEIALQEAWEEAGLTGVLSREPVGSYLYEKYGSTHHVLVYTLRVVETASKWPEQASRERVWLDIKDALERIDDAGLREVIRRGLQNDKNGKRVRVT